MSTDDEFDVPAHPDGGWQVVQRNADRALVRIDSLSATRLIVPVLSSYAA